MARQTGPVFLQGTYGNICAYWLGGQWLVRQKSTLTGKRVKTSPRFRNTMLFAGLMKRSSKIASYVYAALPEHWKEFWMYRSFVGEAMELLKKGHTDEEAREILWERYAAEFGEGYEEEKEFVHGGVGKLWEAVRVITVRALSKYDASGEGMYLARVRGRRKRMRALKRCYEELAE